MFLFDISKKESDIKGLKKIGCLEQSIVKAANSFAVQ